MKLACLEQNYYFMIGIQVQEENEVGILNVLAFHNIESNRTLNLKL